MRKLRLHILFSLTIFLSTHKSYSQTNLIINGNLEDTITCSSHVTYELFANNWWMYWTLDYYRGLPFSFCPNSGMAGTIPFNQGGYQYPHSGLAYVGIVTYLYSNMKWYREYLQAPLTDTLQNGKTYCVSFWYNEADRTVYAIDRMGIYFSANGINLTTSMSFTQYYPQITTPAGQFLNDTANWRQFKTSYTATGNEVYFTLGNFSDSVQTNLQLYPNHSNPAAYSYYLIDDISILPVDLPAHAGKDTSVCKNDSIYIGRPPDVGLDNIWTEIQTGQQVGIGSGIWIKPDTSATYVVTQDICGTITQDTIRVIVNCIDDINNLITKGINISPNPTSDQFFIETNTTDKLIVDLYDINGRHLFSKSVSDKSKIDVTSLDTGIYTLTIKMANLITNKKLVILR